MNKILIISTNSDAAGAPLHVEQVVMSLKDKYSFILFFGEDGIVYQRLKKNGINVNILNGLKSNITPLTDLILIIKIIYIIYKNKPDIIHLHSSKAGFLGRVAGLFTFKRIIFTVHGWSWSSKKGNISQFLLFLEKCISKLCKSEFIFVSNALFLEGKMKIGLNDSNSHVVLNGVKDLQSIENYKVKGPIRLIMPARVAYPKDQLLLAEALSKLDFKFQMIFCGLGTDCNVFKEKIKHIVGNKIRQFKFLGNVNNIADELKKAHVFILISHSEGLPLSLLEAMSVGLPVIASDVGGINEAIINNYNGLLIPSVSKHQICDILGKVLTKSDLYSMSKNSRLLYEKSFTHDQMIKKLSTIYDKN